MPDPLLFLIIGAGGLAVVLGLGFELLITLHGPSRQRANRRAEALLRGVLTPAEYSLLKTHGYLDVRSPSSPKRTYRIPGDGNSIVVVREAGRVTHGLCVRPNAAMPRADVVAAHKLMIEGAEQLYLQHANPLPIRALRSSGIALEES